MNESLAPDFRRSSQSGFDAEVMSQARRAAAQAELSLEEWLSRTIIENARKTGIIPPATPEAAREPSRRADTEQAIQAIARHLERAQQSAQAQGVSLAEWLSRAILANAQSATAPTAAIAAAAPAAPAAPPPKILPELKMPVAPAAKSAPPPEPAAPAPAKPAAPMEPESVVRSSARAALLGGQDDPALRLEPNRRVPPENGEPARRPRRASRWLLWTLLVLLALAAAAVWALPYLKFGPLRAAKEATATISDPVRTAEKPPEAKAPENAGAEPAQPAPPEKKDPPPESDRAAQPGDSRPPDRREEREAEKREAEKREADKREADKREAEKQEPAKREPERAEKSGDKAGEKGPSTPPAADGGNEAELARVPAKDMPKPPASHADWYRRASEAGNAEAQYIYGELLLRGEGVPRDVRAAAEWFRKSAEKGNLARSQFALGLLYQRGIGVERSDVQAVLWFQKAADQGHLPSVTQVGVALLEGRGVRKNEETARRYLERAGEGDEVTAQFTLGRMYETGQGVKRDLVVALKWYILAAEQAHEGATRKVEELSNPSVMTREQQERATELVRKHYSDFRRR